MSDTEFPVDLLRPELKPEVWATLSPAERRVAIAKEVLFLLDGGVIKATKGVFFDLPVSAMTQRDIHVRRLSDLLEKSQTRAPAQPVCYVCAVGGLLLATLMTGKEDPVLYEMDHLGLTGALDMILDVHEDLFALEQLHLIEIAYEAGKGAVVPHNEIEKAAQAWGLYYRLNLEDEGLNAAERDKATLRAIMENIIENKGTFLIPGHRP